MCWYTKSNEISIKVAEEDIPVVKGLDRKNDEEFISPIFRFKWKKGIVYHSILSKPKKYLGSETFSISKGFHSCTKLIYENYYIDGIQFTKMINEFGRTILCRKYDIVNAVIPKGSIYYVNEEGDYVSNQLKIV